jgi:hypothetical protein
MYTVLITEEKMEFKMKSYFLFKQVCFYFSSFFFFYLFTLCCDHFCERQIRLNSHKKDLGGYSELREGTSCSIGK